MNYDVFLEIEISMSIKHLDRNHSNRKQHVESDKNSSDWEEFRFRFQVSNRHRVGCVQFSRDSQLAERLPSGC